MPPVEVPAIRSNSSQTRFRERRSISVSTRAGMSPRIPPPSMLSTRIPRHATTRAVRRALATICCAAVLGTAASAAAAAAPLDPNPCLTVFAKGPALPGHRDGPALGHLPRHGSPSPGVRCCAPATRSSRSGRGPVELHGVRYNRVYMHARQRIYKRGGGWITVRTGARLRLKFAHLSRYWWKFFNAARFELWRARRDGQAHAARCAPGPKVSYCLRDLTAHAPGAERHALLPALPGLQHQRRACAGTCSAPRSAGPTSTRRATPSSGST